VEVVAAETERTGRDRAADMSPCGQGEGGWKADGWKGWADQRTDGWWHPQRPVCGFFRRWHFASTTRSADPDIMAFGGGVAWPGLGSGRRAWPASLLSTRDRGCTACCCICLRSCISSVLLRLTKPRLVRIINSFSSKNMRTSQGRIIILRFLLLRPRTTRPSACLCQ
jgi:hypothetical protein